MRYFKWVGVLSVIALIVACFLPWVLIQSQNLVISGVDSGGTNFGKPGYFNFLMAIFFLAFTFIQRLWAKRVNLLIVAFNLAWAVRNFFIITTCEGGECPKHKIGLYLMLGASLVMLISALLPDMKLKDKNV